jgi:gliding motility-associated-like protein
VTNGITADSIIKSQYITVFAAPVVNFTASDTSACFPFPVQFTDLSTSPNGTISNWLWDFGDGAVSTQRNPLHVYTTSGNFTVTLKVTNSNGCFKLLSHPQYIDVTDGVRTGFTNTSPVQCSVPATISFTNTSTGGGSLNFTWIFGDGTGSNLANPVHVYSATGTYSVMLVTESSLGCRDTLIKNNLISIGAMTSQFNSPDSVCIDQSFTISNTTTPAPISSHWDFGDGTISTQINPAKKYTSAGVFTIKLVNTFSGCMDSTTKTITVRSGPAADFSANQTRSCAIPFTAGFINQTTGNNTYLWNFGDGSTSTQANPVHTYTTAGTYPVTLVAVNETGCSDTITKADYIQIKEPVLTLNNLPQQGCIPLTISLVSTLISTDPVATYLWNFGDGTTSAAVNPSHTYTTPGTYTVSLTISTTGGCTVAAVLNNAVKAGNKPQAAFSADPTDECAQHPIQFTDNSTGNVDQWLWTFGDGITSTVQNPLHTYEEVGPISVTLVVWSNGCADTLTIPNIVNIRPPVASFRPYSNCTDKYKVDFVDQSLGAQTWRWEFGDSTFSTQQSPSHTYASPGTYVPYLTVTNGNCVYTTYRVVLIIDEKARFSADNNTACKNTTIHFTGENINAANINSWRWDFGDGNTSNDPSSSSHTYTIAGNYTVSLTIIDLMGCSDTQSIPLTILGPRAAFGSSISAACFGADPVLFYDSSTADGSHPLVKWIWNFGDGIIDSTSAPPYMHNYTVAGDFAVSLTVVDNNGCRDSLRKNSAVIIGHPNAAFNSPDSLSCTDRPVRFVNTSTGNDLQYLWNFGDGSGSTSVNPIHYYNGIGVYTVSLSVVDPSGCRDSVIRNAFINISFPTARFSISDSFSTCPPLRVEFTSASLNYTNLQWDFGDGNNSSLSSPSHVYTYPGIYTAKLIVTGPGGCRDSMYKLIEVRGPRGSFNYIPLQGCKPLTVAFTATTIDRISFTWDFSDGTTVATMDSILSHTYTFAGYYVPKMILEDITGCRVPIVGTDTIRVVGVNAGIKMSQSRFCDSGNVSFFDSTISNDLITAWQWDFGDGETSNSPQPVHHYASPGIYTVNLAVTTEAGCSDARSLTDTVKVFASPIIAINGDSAACVPAQLGFVAQVLAGNPSLLNWSWTFGNGGVSLGSLPPIQSYPSPGAFNITSIVVDEHGCRDTATKTINIYPLPNTDAGANAIVCAGSSTQLQASGATAYLWNASPGLSCTGCSNPIALPGDKTTYVVTGTSEHGCIKKDSVTVGVQKHFVLNLSPGDTICTGESARLIASGADQYSWSPSTGLDNASIASPSASPSTSTLYTLTAKDSLHCFTETGSVFIKVYPIPTVEAGQDATIVVGNQVPLHGTGSPDIVSWKWRPAYNLSCSNCADPVAAPRQTTKYLLEVKNEGGCLVRDYLTIYVTCNKGELFIPNTFSPNGDGMNDRFYPRARGTFMIRSFRVYNRWGELVFEKLSFSPNDASSGWDGKFGGKTLSPDVYVYICEVQCENGEMLRYTGDVTLIQ